MLTLSIQLEIEGLERTFRDELWSFTHENVFSGHAFVFEPNGKSIISIYWFFWKSQLSIKYDAKCEKSSVKCKNLIERLIFFFA